MSQLSFQDTLTLLGFYRNYAKQLEHFYKDKHVKHRCLNFPENVSEHLVLHLIRSCENQDCRKNTKGGDLVIIRDNKLIKIEVKCFTSTGPSSFGPNESWDELYFLNATDFMNDNYVLYKVELSNTDEVFRNIPVNKTQTFGDQCKEKRRPRISFEHMLDYIAEYTSVVYDGNPYELETQELFKCLQL
jgi:hypothetical protein